MPFIKTVCLSLFSNSHSSSYTSDSGTDSGSKGSSGYNRAKGRPTGNKTQPRSFTAPTNEGRREEESGSSSGVDTDSAVNHTLPNITAKVVGVCHVPVRNVTNNARGSSTGAQGISGPRTSPRKGESRERKAMSSNSRNATQARATSDLEGSDIDIGNDDAIDTGGLAMSPSTNISVQIREINLPLQRVENRDIRKESSSSNEQDDKDRDESKDSHYTNKIDDKNEEECIDDRVERDSNAEDNSRVNRNDSASSIERDLEVNESASDSSSVNISPTTSSSSSANVSSEGSASFNEPKGNSHGRKKACSVTFKTEGLPSPPEETPSTRTSSINADENSSETGAPPNATNEQEQEPCNASKKNSSEMESIDEVFESSDQTFESRNKDSDSNKDNTDVEGLAVAALSLNSEDNDNKKQDISEEASGWEVKEVNSASASGWTEGRVEQITPAGTSGRIEDQGGDNALADASDWVEGKGVEAGAEGGANINAEDNDAVPGRQRRGNKKNRRKKKGKNSAVNQATEAEAHFMFELAKTVLTRAGGNSSTSVFSTPSTSTSHGGPHRGLQLCAFELGLFALGLHNRTSVNWLSRTYSSHVSWISGQAMEIGSTAIQLLIERWEGNLTPSEVASIADRASRSNDPTMVRAAAELGLSCLHMAHTLNPGEIQRALLQCRDEDTQLLDRACQAVESAARGGGVYPEVMFDVARHWHHLHEQSQTNNSRTHKENSRRGSQSSRSQPQPPASSSTSSVTPFLHTSPLGSHPSFSSMPPPPYQTAEQYVQAQMHQQVHLMNQGNYATNTTYRSNNQPNYGYNTRQLHSNQFQISGK